VMCRLHNQHDLRSCLGTVSKSRKNTKSKLSSQRLSLKVYKHPDMMHSDFKTLHSDMINIVVAVCDSLMCPCTLHRSEYIGRHICWSPQFFVTALRAPAVSSLACVWCCCILYQGVTQRRYSNTRI
jgi:hypothetical protein